MRRVDHQVQRYEACAHARAARCSRGGPADVHVVTGQGCTVATYVCKAGSVMGTSYSVAYQMRLLKLLAEMKFDFALANEVR